MLPFNFKTYQTNIFYTFLSLKKCKEILNKKIKLQNTFIKKKCIQPSFKLHLPQFYDKFLIIKHTCKDDIETGSLLIGIRHIHIKILWEGLIQWQVVLYYICVIKDLGNGLNGQWSLAIWLLVNWVDCLLQNVYRTWLWVPFGPNFRKGCDECYQTQNRWHEVCRGLVLVKKISDPCKTLRSLTWRLQQHPCHNLANLPHHMLWTITKLNSYCSNNLSFCIIVIHPGCQVRGHVSGLEGTIVRSIRMLYAGEYNGYHGNTVWRCIGISLEPVLGQSDQVSDVLDTCQHCSVWKNANNWCRFEGSQIWGQLEVKYLTFELVVPLVNIY